METIEEPESNTTFRLIVAAVIVVVLAGFGALGYFTGTGWFGYRQILYGSGEIYLLNLGEEPLEVSVDGREKKKVPAGDAAIADLIGGTSKVVVYDAKGNEVETHTVTTDNSHALLKLTDKGCLVASDVTSFYESGGADELEFVQMLEDGDRKYVPGSRNVIWPRKKFPRQLAAGEGDGIWIELVGCPLLEQEKFLRAYLRVRLKERINYGDEKDKPPPRKTMPMK